MIGLDYQSRIAQLLSEFSSTWVDLKTTFDLLYEAAKDFSKETRSCHASQTITTVASQAAYGLKPDFLEILTTDDHNDPVVKYYDGSNTEWLSWETYSDFLQNANSAGTPTSFCVTDAAISTRLTGTATATSAASGGESTLTAATTLIALYPGDMIVNTTYSYIGYVIASAAAPTTAMFNTATRGGAYVGWVSGNGYMVQPASRYQIVLDPPPDTSGETITVPYYAKPLPVYSDYRTYPFATGYEEALIKYAVWLYKYKDSKPNMGDPLYMAYQQAMRKGKNVQHKAVGGGGFKVSYMKS